MISNYSMVIGSKIKQIRTAKRLSLRELSELASKYMPDERKISHVSIMYYENDGRSMDLDILIAVCKALNIDMPSFLDECIKEVEK